MTDLIAARASGGWLVRLEWLVTTAVRFDTLAMQATLVMTVIGKDRTGLVESVAQLVAEHGGNWLESRMCRLGGEFAGIVRVTVPKAQQQILEASLGKLSGLTIVVRGDEPAQSAATAALVALEVVGQDRPGIVREITRALSAQGINVEELTTECVSAPMSGETLFQAKAKILIPANVALDKLRQTLESSLAGLTVELERLK
jgi:glycine cleavage system regulatory protein